MSKKKEIVPVGNFDKLFWGYNHPVGMERNESTKEVTYKIYMPRKGRIWDSMGNETVPEDQLKTFCENSAMLLEHAAKQFRDFANGEIDSVYYWDLPGAF